MDKNENTRDFSKKLTVLVLPIAFQMFMQALVSASDAFMLGALTQESLSAVSLASQVPFVLNMLLMAMTTGLSLFAAQFWGKGDTDSVEKYFGYAMRVSFATGLLFMAVCLIAPSLVMKIFTDEVPLIEMGAVYLRTVALSFLLTAISQTYLCALKNSGRAGIASVISSSSVVINIILNSFLIFGLFIFPKLEIAGAALATVIARVIELLWCVAEISRRDSVKLRIKYVVRVDAALRKKFWKYTAPSLGNQIVWAVGFSMYSVIMGHLGNDAVAANSVANIIKNLLSCVVFGLGNAGGILVGNELGAGRLDIAKEYGARLIKLAILFGAVSGLMMPLTEPIVLKVNNLSDTAAGYLHIMLWMCTYNMVGQAINVMTINGVFSAGGDTRFGFICDTVTMWAYSIPFGLIAAFVLKLPVAAVFFVITLDEIVKLPAVYRNYKKYRWLKDLTEGE